MSNTKLKKRTQSEIQDEIEEGMKKFQELDDSSQDYEDYEDYEDPNDEENIDNSQSNDSINVEEAQFNDFLFEDSKSIDEEDLNEALSDIDQLEEYGIDNESDEDSDYLSLLENSKLDREAIIQRNRQLTEQYHWNMDPLMLNYNVLINNYVYDKPVQRPKSLKFANKIQYTEYLLQMHIEDYLAGLRNELNQCIKWQTEDTNQQLLDKVAFDYLDFLNYGIEEIQFTEVGFSVLMKVTRDNEKVFLLNAQETDTFKDESLIVFLNHKNEFLFTGTIISLEEESHYQIYLEKETNVEVREMTVRKNRKQIMEEKKKQRMKKDKNQQTDEEEEEEDSDEGDVVDVEKKEEKDNVDNEVKKSKANKNRKDQGRDENGEYEDHYTKKVNNQNTNVKEISRKQVEFKLKLKININKDNAEKILQELIEQVSFLSLQLISNCYFISQKTYGNSKRRLLAFEVLSYWLPFKYTYLSLNSMLTKEISFEEEIIKGNIKPNQYYYNKEIPSDVTEDQICYPQYNSLFCHDDIKIYFKDVTDRVDQLKNLDPTQNECLKYMLTTPISLIQGPPGTGKTFIAFEAMKLLLQTYSKRSERKPILIICRRNETVNDYSLRLIKLFDEEYKKRQQEERKIKEEERKKAQEKEEEFKIVEQKNKASGQKNNKKAKQNKQNAKQNKQNAKQNNSKMEKSNFEYVKKENASESFTEIGSPESEKQKEPAQSKIKKVYPYLRLGTGGLTIPKEIEVLFLPQQLKFIKKSKQALKAQMNLQKLILNQKEDQHQKIDSIEWKQFENKLNKDLILDESEQFSFSTIIAQLFISEFFSQPSVDQIICTQKILENKEEIFLSWLFLQLNSVTIEENLKIEIARDIKKKIDYLNQSLIKQSKEFQDMYQWESYNLVTFKSYFINKEGEQLEFTNENFLKFISSFTKLSEMSYFHINSIKEYIRYSCKSKSMQQFINDVMSYEIKHQKEKELLKQKQLQYFKKKDIICKQILSIIYKKIQ